MSWAPNSGALQTLLERYTDRRWTFETAFDVSGSGPGAVVNRRMPFPQSYHDHEAASPRRSMPRSLTLQFRDVPVALVWKLQAFYEAHRSRAFSMALDASALRFIQVVFARPFSFSIRNTRGSGTIELRESLTSRQIQG